jgi:dTMP kinase
MFKKKFFFIVFEGVEGTGKTYQINKLCNNLKKLKIFPIKTREPGGSKSAELIRSLIFHRKSDKFDKLTDFYLINAARNEHYQKKIIPCIKNKRILICDRFIDSTFAYQVRGKKINHKLNSINQKYILKNFKPNLTIVLKSNFQTIFQRLKKRGKKNKFDKLKLNFYKKAQNVFLKLANNNKLKYVVFDSSLNNSDLERKIFNLVLKRIK